MNETNYAKTLTELNRHLRSAYSYLSKKKAPQLKTTLRKLFNSFETLISLNSEAMYFYNKKVSDSTEEEITDTTNKIVDLVEDILNAEGVTLSEEMEEHLNYFLQNYKYYQAELNTSLSLERLAHKYHAKRDHKGFAELINLMSHSVSRVENSRLNYLNYRFMSSFLWVEIDHISKSLKDFLKKNSPNFSFILESEKEFKKKKNGKVLLKEVKDFFKTLGDLEEDFLSAVNDNENIIYKKVGLECYSLGLFQKKAKVVTSTLKNLDDQLNLVHEIAHAVHFNLNIDKDALSYDPKTIVTETIAIFFEMSFLSYRIKVASKKDREKRRREFSAFVFKNIIENGRLTYFESEIFKLGDKRDITPNDLKRSYSKSRKDFCLPKGYDKGEWYDSWGFFDPFLRASYFMASIGAVNILESILTHKKDYQFLKKEMSGGSKTKVSDLYDLEDFLEGPERLFSSILKGYLNNE